VGAGGLPALDERRLPGDRGPPLVSSVSEPPAAAGRAAGAVAAGGVSGQSQKGRAAVPPGGPAVAASAAAPAPQRGGARATRGGAAPNQILGDGLCARHTAGRPPAARLDADRLPQAGVSGAGRPATLPRRRCGAHLDRGWRGTAAAGSRHGGQRSTIAVKRRWAHAGRSLRRRALHSSHSRRAQ
jgi:hypothetical protein